MYQGSFCPVLQTSVNKIYTEERKRKKKKRERKRENVEAGFGIQGQVQCKSLFLVNVESAENVNKQTTAVTHSYRDTHTHTRWRGGSEGRTGKQGSDLREKERWVKENKDDGTCWILRRTYMQTFTLTRRAQKKPSNPLNKQTSLPASPPPEWISIVNTPINSDHVPPYPNSILAFTVQHKTSTALNPVLLKLKPYNVYTVNANSFYNNMTCLVLLRHDGAFMRRFSGWQVSRFS